MKRAALLIALCGCDVVFGLDRAPPDAPPDVVVSGRITRRYLHGEAGLGLVTELAPLVQAEAPTVRYAGQDVPIGWSASEGLFTFEVPGSGPYQLLYDGIEYQLAAQSVKIDTLIPGRKDAIAPAGSTVLRITPTTALPLNANVFVLTTGIFSVSKANTVSTSEFTLNWPNAGFFGTKGLLEAAKFDEAYLTVYAHDTRGYEVLDTIVPVSVTLAQGTVTTAPGPVMPLARDHCVQVDPDPINAELSRLQRVYPQFSPAGASWTLYMAARPELGLSAPYTVALQDVTAVDALVDVQYRVPLPSYGPLMTYAARVDRSVDNVKLDATVVYYQLIEARSTCVQQPTAVGIALPKNPVLAGVALLDSVTIGMPAATDAELTWDDAAGTIAPTAYRVRLSDLSTGTERLVRTIYTAERRAVIDGKLLEGDGRYVIEIAATTGRDTFAAGELTLEAFPAAAGIVRTPPFKISK